MPEIVKHQDFGEKIGGAKKDLWNERGLYSSDLSVMNEREVKKYVKKDNIWKKNDYQAMIEEGISFDVVYFIKKVHDSISVAPVFLRIDNTEEKRLERQKQYIDTVRELESITLSVKTKEDALNLLERFFVGNKYMEVLTHIYKEYRYTDKGRDNPIINNKLFKVMNLSSRRFEQDITQKAIKEQFGIPKENKIPRGYDIHFNSKTDDNWKSNTWYVTHGHFILETNFETKEDAIKWVQDKSKNQNSERKKRFVPPQFEKLKREGPDYHKERDINGKDYLDTFGFKGGEFGNWMTQIDRQTSLNLGFEALKDLAEALEITNEDISYNGELSIAFGARGSGNAVAHYEPLRKVINLTKMRGAGSLAHEWWHGLDDYLGTKIFCNDGFMSEHARKYPVFKNLLDVIKYKPETLEQAIEQTKKRNERLKNNADRCLKVTVSRILQNNEETLPEFEKLRQGFLNGEAGNIEKISVMQKSIVGRVIPKEVRTQLENFERCLGLIDPAQPKIGKVQTDYFRHSEKIGEIYGKDGGYWESDVELTARAFATYIMDKLGRKSDYLMGHAECAIGIYEDKFGEKQILRAYPLGEERVAINKAFDDVIAELKREKYLNHNEKHMPKIIEYPNIHKSVSLPNEQVNEQISLFDDLFYSQSYNCDEENEYENY